MHAIILGFALFMTILIAVLQIDDDLNPDAGKLLEQATAAAPNDTYIYLIGLDAPAGQDPLQAGKIFFATLQAREQASDINPAEPVRTQQLPLPEGELFCGYRQEDCFEKILRDDSELDDAIAPHTVLLQRYEHFLGMTGFRTLTQPTPEEVYPSYQYIAKANRLVMLRAIRDMRNGNGEQAAANLLNHIAAIRSHLQQADNLIGKMIYAAVLSETIDVLSYVARDTEHAALPSINSITTDERDLHLAMAREFAVGAAVYRRLDHNPEGWNSDSTIPAWIFGMLFKANMSINAMYPMFRDAAALSVAEPQAFVQQIQRRKPFEPKAAYIRNYVGTVLNNIAQPSMETYIGRLLDLDVKIALFNQTIAQGKNTATRQRLINPYYALEEETFASEAGNRICMKGPLADQNNNRCLLITAGAP